MYVLLIVRYYLKLFIFQIIMNIKHLVIGGGGPAGVLMYGALKHLNNNNIWNLQNIQSIYSTSIGSMLATILLLNLEWNLIDDYLINRPWDKLFDKYSNNILNINNNIGFVNSDIFYEILDPLFKCANIDKNITLLEFYNLNKVNLNIFTTNINNIELISTQLNYKTYPDLNLITAISMSSSFPILFTPIFYQDKCFIDGGMINNYPVKNCIKDNNCDEKEILSFCTNGLLNYNNIILNNKDSKLTDLTLLLITKLVRHAQYHNELSKYCIIVDKMIDDFDEWYDVINNKDKRLFLINKGVNYAEDFLNNLDKLDKLDKLDNNN